MYVNPVANAASPMPRHKEIDEYLVRKICRELQIPMP
jgi:mRNA interferase HicA